LIEWQMACNLASAIIPSSPPPRQSQMTIPRAGIRFSLLATALLSTAVAAQQQIVVPAFFPIAKSCTASTQGDDTGCADANKGGDWSRIVAAGNKVGVVVVDFKEMGKGGDNVGPCTATPEALFTCLHQNGVKIFGYVSTLFDQRLDPISGTDDTSVSDWYARYCPPGGQCYVDGIFFDNGPNVGESPAAECEQQKYYGSTTGCLPPGGIPDGLYQEVTSRFQGTCAGAGASARGGSGTKACVMLNASQFPNSWALSASDYLTLWERPKNGQDQCPPATPDQQDYLTNFIPQPSGQNPAGWYATTRATAAHIVSAVGDPVNDPMNSMAEVASIISASRDANHSNPALLYVHDQHCAARGSDYGQLSAYFEQVAAAMTPPGGGTTTPPDGGTPPPPATTPIDSGSMMVLIQGILDGPPAVSAPPPPPPDAGTPNPPPEGNPGLPPTNPGPPPSNPND
jgi:hypothetical protein